MEDKGEKNMLRKYLDIAKKVISVVVSVYPILKPILQANGIPAPDLGDIEQILQGVGITTLAVSKPILTKKK